MKKLIFLLSLCLTAVISAQEVLPQLTYKLAATGGRSIGDTVTVVLAVKIPKEHHLYGNPLGPGIGKPTTLLPLEQSGLIWLNASVQKLEKFTPPGFEDQWVWSWHDHVSFVLQYEITDTLSTATLELNGLICKDACIPIYDTISIRSSDIALLSEQEITSLDASTPFPIQGVYEPEVTLSEVEKTNPSPVAQADSMSIWVAIVLAFLAGIILNFMPCVLPVLGIKILAFSQGRSQSKRDTVIHSLVFAAGMLFVFMALAGVAIAITQTGKSWAWGQQFQSSIFTIIVISLIYVFSLGMFDLFIILVPSKFGELDQKQSGDSLIGNFLKGVFATIMATPCSGPLLGGVLAWALNGQSPLTIFTVFTSIGLGMASPYLLLASFDKLARLIPKPGAWMEDFKHILGFVMLGFTIWLIKALPESYIIPTLSLLLALTAALMVYARISPFGSSIKRKAFGIVIGATIVLITAFTMFQTDDTVWEPFTEAAFIEAQEINQDIIIDFTAEWCLNCQSNKTFVYNTDEVQKLLHTKNAKAFKADLTRDNPIAESYRNKFGSKSVPFLVILPDGKEQKIKKLRDIVTKGQVLSILEELDDK